jgi:8-oxo-dGTP diphosphatase
MRQVTAAVIIEDGRLFLARRPPGDPLAGLWELPGGKIEGGETPQQCLERELQEELCMEANAGQIVAETVYHYEHGSFEILALEVARTSPFDLNVHDACCWAAPDQLARLPLAPADRGLVDQLLAAGVLG